MRFTIAPLALAVLFPRVSGSPLDIPKPISGNEDVLEKRAPPSAAVCRGVNLIVTILKLNKATPFCSSFLGISATTFLTYETVTTFPLSTTLFVAAQTTTQPITTS